MEPNLSSQLDDSVFRRFVLEHASEPLLLLDAEGRLLQANQAAQRVEGLEPARLLADGALSWLPAFLGELHASGSAFTEVAAPDAGARRHGFALRAFVIGACIVVSVRELSRERELEAELAHLRRVESIGMLTASVIHDLNNLLTPILCLADLLRAQVAEGGSGLEFAAEIGAASKRAAAVISPLLAFVRGRPSRVDQVALREVVLELRPLMERMLGPRVELVVALAGDAGGVLVDRQRLDNALLNLVANARDAMPEGGVLTIESGLPAAAARADAAEQRASAASQYACLRIRDTGVGMSPEVRARVFERFFTTKEVGQGSGIGLAAVRKFVQESGGDIQLESAPGQGTAVTLLLPRVSEFTQPADPFPAAPAAASGRETVLVVDEDEHVRKAVRVSLERKQYRVIEAASADDALRLAEICGPRLDLILIDTALRRWTPRSFLQRLRAHVRRARVLFMSGDPHALPELEGDVAVPLLRKAFSGDALDRAVRAALST